MIEVISVPAIRNARLKGNKFFSCNKGEYVKTSDLEKLLEKYDSFKEGDMMFLDGKLIMTKKDFLESELKKE